MSATAAQAWAELEGEVAVLTEKNAALLAEVERLQRERAEWRDRADALMTEQMTQMRDLLAEVEALRARLVVDDAMVERADAAFKSTPIAEARNLTRRMLEAALNG